MTDTEMQRELRYGCAIVFVAAFFTAFLAVFCLVGIRFGG